MRESVRGIAAAVLLFGSAAPAIGAADEELRVFDGRITITSASVGCKDAGDKAGDAFKLVIRPEVNPFNGRAGGFQMLFDGVGAHIFMMKDGKPLLGGRRKGVFDEYHLSGSVGVSGPIDAPFDLTLSPALIGPGTKAVTIRGTVKNFHMRTGCTVGVSGSAKLRP